MVGEGSPSSLHMAMAHSLRARLEASASNPSVQVVKREDRRASAGPAVGLGVDGGCEDGRCVCG